MSKKDLLAYGGDTWDFGLTGDCTPYRCVATTYDELWVRLDQRYKTMSELHHINEQLKSLLSKQKLLQHSKAVKSNV